MQIVMLSNFKSKYKVQCKIGEGSFSEVLKCQNKKTGALIAAKQLKKPFKSPKQALELPEIIAMKKVTRHPNILQLLEAHFDEGSGKVTLVFELMDMSLCDLMKRKRRLDFKIHPRRQSQEVPVRNHQGSRAHP